MLEFNFFKGFLLDYRIEIHSPRVRAIQRHFRCFLTISRHYEPTFHFIWNRALGRSLSGIKSERNFSIVLIRKNQKVQSKLIRNRLFNPSQFGIQRSPNWVNSSHPKKFLGRIILCILEMFNLKPISSEIFWILEKKLIFYHHLRNIFNFRFDWIDSVWNFFCWLRIERIKINKISLNFELNSCWRGLVREQSDWKSNRLSPKIQFR